LTTVVVDLSRECIIRLYIHSNRKISLKLPELSIMPGLLGCISRINCDRSEF